MNAEREAEPVKEPGPHPRGMWDPGWKYGRYLFFLVQVFLLYFIFSGFVIGDTQRATWAIIALAITFLPGIAEWRLNMTISWTVKFLIGLSLFLHIAGGINRWYFLFYPFYDKVAHFVSALTIALLVYLLLLGIGAYTRYRAGRYTAPVIILAVTMLFGQAWEFTEFSIDSFFSSTYYMGGLDSTIDTCFNLLGALIIAALAYIQLKRSPVAEVFQRYIRW